MDIDIDLQDRQQLLSLIDHIPASIAKDNKLSKHNTGIYFQEIEFNPLQGISAIDYKEAEMRGFFKIDLLNVSAYDRVYSERHLVELLNQDPNWKLLESKEICDQLFHLNGHHRLVAALKPKSIEELAIVLALIRPSKKHLVDQCIKHGFDSIKKEIWEKSEEDYSFKKSHSIGYASLIVVQLNSLNLS